MTFTVICNILLLIITTVILGFIINIYDDKRQSKVLKFTYINDTPILSVSQTDVKLNFILDTGSSISAINNNALDMIITQPTNTSCDFIGIEGNAANAQCYEIEFMYDDKFYIHEFACVDLNTAFENVSQAIDIPIHGILGCDFLNAYNFTIDFKQHSCNGK